MECIYAWSEIYAINEKYIGGYHFLLDKGIKFPENLAYFKKEEIEIKMMEEVKEEVNREDEIIVDNKEILLEKITYFEIQKENFLNSIFQNKTAKNLSEGN